MAGEMHYPPIGTTRLRSNSLGVAFTTMAVLSGLCVLLATGFEAALTGLLLLGGGVVTFSLLWRAGWVTGTVIEHTRDPGGGPAIRVRGRDGVEVLQPVSSVPGILSFLIATTLVVALLAAFFL